MSAGTSGNPRTPLEGPSPAICATKMYSPTNTDQPRKRYVHYTRSCVEFCVEGVDYTISSLIYTGVEEGTQADVWGVLL